jgi:hypothetical protein
MRLGTMAPMPSFKPHATMPPCSILANRKQLATGSFISRVPSSRYSSYGGCCAFSFSDRRVLIAIVKSLFQITSAPFSGLSKCATQRKSGCFEQPHNAEKPYPVRILRAFSGNSQYNYSR